MIATARDPSSRWVSLTLAGVLLLNLFDLVATVFFVTAGYAEEANPVMATFLELGAPGFALAKLGLVSAGVWVLWRHRERLLARLGSVGALAVYVGVGIFHLYGAQLVLSA